ARPISTQELIGSSKHRTTQPTGWATKKNLSNILFTPLRLKTVTKWGRGQVHTPQAMPYAGVLIGLPIAFPMKFTITTMKHRLLSIVEYTHQRATLNRSTMASISWSLFT